LKIEGQESKIDWLRLATLVASMVLSGVCGYFFQPLISGNEQAINTIVTIFSILAGFLIAVITFIAEPTIRSATSWKDLQLNKRNVRNRIFRYQLLFYLYLGTLGLAFGMFLLPDKYIHAILWLERGFIGLSMFVFISSFKLPGSLMELQMAHYEAKLKEKRPMTLNDQTEK